MRFTCLLAAFATITSVLGGQVQFRKSMAQPITPRSDGLFTRDLVGVTACVQLPNTALDIGVDLGALAIGRLARVSITLNLCLCLQNGALTPTSVANLRQQLSTKATITATLLSGLTVDLRLLVPNLDLLTTIIGDGLIASIARPVDTCKFKPSAVPNSCGACTYDCPLPAFNVKCDKACLATGTICPSGLSVTRRSRFSDLICPKGHTACGLPNQVGKMECLDTQRSVEACGGCEFPLIGQVKGTDCTAIDNTSDVTCVAGKCVIGSCLRGYRLWGGQCVLAGLVKQA